MRALFTVTVLIISTTTWAASARIVSWNIASNFNDITDTRRAELVAGVQELDADILVLAEVRPHNQGMAIATDLTAAGECYNMTLPDNPGSSLDLGILSRCDVNVSNVRFIDIGRRLRDALVADVTADNFDFVLIAVHLKASRNSDARRQRDIHANISGYIEALLELTPERDVIVLEEIPGNFNLLKRTDLRFATTDDLTGTIIEYQRSAEVILLNILMGKTLAEYADDVSDHLPVVAVFDTATVKFIKEIRSVLNKIQPPPD